MMITQKISEQLSKALEKMGIFETKVLVDKTKNIKFGDFYTNVAMTLSKRVNQSPLVVAKEIINNLDQDLFFKVNLQPPGFLNFTLKAKDHEDLLTQIYDQKDLFGQFAKKNITYNVEYVSANPTGYLHIAHAANAIYGDILANLLKIYGYDVKTEYWINDAGNQIDKLAMSVLVRYLQLQNINIELPTDAYHGQEIYLVAQALYEIYKGQFINVRLNEKEEIDDVIVNEQIKKFAVSYLLDEIKKDLASINTYIDTYTSENWIRSSGRILEVLSKIKQHTYTLDGALWLRTTAFGDDKDRVLIKSDGSYTYFTPDIAYHDYKFSKDNTTKLIDVWGTDHLGYIARLKAAMSALGYDPNNLEIVCAQVMKLVKNNEEFKLSKRSGQSLTIKDLVEIIGKDALRWFLGSSSMNSHVVIDVDIALSKNNNNPLYYVQYAHARANQVLNKQVYEFDFKTDLLIETRERELLNQLHFYKQTIANAANNREPHRISNYLYDLAQIFHNYYANIKINDENNKALSAQRYTLVWCVKQVLANGLAIMKITPYDQMY
nr:arginine--tRNA ligase [Ureaplasma urealyticum]